MVSSETPSNIKMIKTNNSNYSYYSYKKHYEKESEFQEINNFNLNNIDYNDTTSGLNVIQNGDDDSYNKDFYDYLLQNLETNRKKANREYECDINNNKLKDAIKKAEHGYQVYCDNCFLHKEAQVYKKDLEYK